MGYLVNLLMLSLNIVYSFLGGITYAENSTDLKYAKVNEDCVLYKDVNMNNAYDSIYFEVPETYFVTILDEIKENKCYKVQYDKYIGYVDMERVDLVSFSPIIKTLSNVTFDIKSNSGTQIWSAPTTSSNIYTTLSAGLKNINYIASVSGEIPSGGVSDVWYYVNYTPSSNSTNFYEGYIYSENTINLSEILLNTETNPDVITDNMYDENIIFISSTIKTIIVAIIAIPIILFFAIILYKLIKKLKKNTKYNKNNNFINELNSSDKSNDNKSGFVSKFKEMFRLDGNKKSDKNYVDLNDDELL